MDFKSLISNVKDWQDFEAEIYKLQPKKIGDAFELLTKYYFKINPVYSNYENIWLLREVPNKILEYLELPSHDLGIDLIAQKGEEFHAIQCKYHSNSGTSITFQEVSTFISLLEGNSKLTQGYISSTADSISHNLNKIKTKRINLILSDSWMELGEDFFDRLRCYIEERNYKPLVYSPREHQIKSINDCLNHFNVECNSRGKLILPCGVGKSLTGFWMALELKSSSTIIAVPSLALVRQTLNVYLREIVARDMKVEWLCVCSDEAIGFGDEVLEKTENLGVPCETDPIYIESWLKRNKNKHTIIFTTYQSGRIIADISKRNDFKFEVGIFDEAHKTVGSNRRLFSYLLFEENIQIEKRIFMTATERFYAGSQDDIVSMDDDLIYGKVFSQMSFKEAISRKLLTDYKIITIDVKKSEVATFLKANTQVQLNQNKKGEIDIRSLASMIALRKAMDCISIKKAVSFHSTIKKAEINCELQKHITKTYEYNTINSFTVSSRMPTTKRNILVNEFANSSEKALITNSRCLSEGVDVPGIDCIIFADPKRSNIDIVQSIGRALRIKEGKESGYIILPLVYDDIQNTIDDESFNDIVCVVRGLASNDERIIEYFKDIAESKSNGIKSQLESSIFDFQYCSLLLNETDIIDQIKIKIWESLSRLEKLKYLPFSEAKEFVRQLKLKSSNQWYSYINSKNKPLNIPSSPQSVYKNVGWIGMGDWLGTKSVSKKVKVFEEFNKARLFARSLGLKKTQDWIAYSKSGAKPENIPMSPFSTYKDKGWISIADWLGTENIQNQKIEFKSFESAREFAGTLGFSSSSEWQKFCRSGKKPSDIPRNPDHYYIGKWQGWPHFFKLNNSNM